MNFQFTLENEDGEEEKFSLPGKYEVCPRCEGEGCYLNPSIGEHAYSQEEFEEAFSDEEDRQQYFTRGGIYDVTCATCKGKRVVEVIDEGACRSSEQKVLLKRYQEHQADQEEYEAECRAEARRERMMMGDY